MPVMTNTPVTKKDKEKETKDSSKKKTLPTLECNIANCNFTCKYGKHMRDHQLKVHEVDQDKSTMDMTVDISASELNLTATGSSQTSTDSEEANIHSSMEQRPHSTLAVIPDPQERKKAEDTPATPSTSSSNRKRKTSDEDGDLEAKKERRHEETIDIEPPDSPATAKRKAILEEARKTVESEKEKLVGRQQAYIYKLLTAQKFGVYCRKKCTWVFWLDINF